jgi:hypothetical protein
LDFQPRGNRTFRDDLLEYAVALNYRKKFITELGGNRRKAGPDAVEITANSWFLFMMTDFYSHGTGQ